MEGVRQQKINPKKPTVLSSCCSSSNALTTVTTSLGVGLGLGFGFLYFFTPHTLKPVSSAIKVADGALKGTKALQKLVSPSPSAVLFFSKAFIKLSDKASKHLTFAKTNPQNLSLVTKRLKASIAALNLVQYLRFPPAVGSGFLGIGFLSIGYKFSKNLLRVLEGFVGIQLDSAVRTGFEAMELFVKTALLTREFSRIANWVGWKIENGCNPTEMAAKPAHVLVRTNDFKLGACLNSSRIDRSCCCHYDNCSYLGRLNLDCAFCKKVLIVEESSQTCLSELLCLALPVHERIYAKPLVKER